MGLNRVQCTTQQANMINTNIQTKCQKILLEAIFLQLRKLFSKFLYKSFT